MTPERQLVAMMCDTLRGLTGAEEFLAPLETIGDDAVAVPPTGMPPVVTDHDWVALAPAETRPLVGTMVRHAPALSWWKPYDGDPRAGVGFAERATANSLAGPFGALRSETVAAGFFPVGPGVDYADHAHEPDEIYVPIAGRATFWCDIYGRIEAGPGAVIRQPPWTWHGMRTGREPVLILWVWIGVGLARNPVFRGEDGAAVEVDL